MLLHNTFCHLEAQAGERTDYAPKAYECLLEGLMEMKD